MYIASIATDVRVHTWPNGQLLHAYKSNIQGFMKSVSWGKDGSWLVLVPSKGPAEVISVRDNLKHLHSIHEIQQPTCAAFQNSTKRNIALGTTTGTVLVYDIKSKTVRKHFPRAPSTIFKVEYCAKDSFLVAACENGEILLYNSITYNLSSSYKIPNSRTVSNIRCHPSRRNLVAGGSQEGIVAIWDIHTSKLKYHHQAHSAPIADLTFSPLRSDLLVTVGLDRKFMFYETSSNTCIMQKVMDRSSTAVDFCPDGIGLAVALQDGTVHTYDTRQMNNPLYAFMAHSGQIKQLLFQKKPCEDSCEYSFGGERIEMLVDGSQPMETNRASLSYDSFGHMFCGDVLPDIPEVNTEASTDEVGDSFIDAIGLNSQNVTINSLKQDGTLGIAEGIQKLLDEKPNLLEDNVPYSRLSKNSDRTNENLPKQGSISQSRTNENPPKQGSISQSNEKTFQRDPGIPVRMSSDNLKVQGSSTPKFLMQEAQTTTYISPILSANQTVPTVAVNSSANFAQADLQKIRDAIKDEMKLEMDTFKQHLKYEFMDIIAHMRRHFLDLQMSIVKEFVQMESNFNRFKEDIAAEECFGEDMLVQENIRLRKEVAALRDQLLTNNDD